MFEGEPRRLVTKTRSRSSYLYQKSRQIFVTHSLAFARAHKITCTRDAPFSLSIEMEIYNCLQRVYLANQRRCLAKQIHVVHMFTECVHLNLEMCALDVRDKMAHTLVGMCSHHRHLYNYTCAYLDNSRCHWNAFYRELIVGAVDCVIIACELDTIAALYVIYVVDCILQVNW